MKKYLHLWREITLLLVAFSWLVFSYFISLGGAPDIWFARSGAILVLAAVVTEYRLSTKQQKNISRATVVAGMGIPNSSNVPQANKFVGFFSYFLAVLGTVVWAYGDILYSFLTNHST